MSSHIDSIDAPNYDNLAFTRKTVGPTTASIYPATWSVGAVHFGDTGLTMELGQPQFVSKIDEWEESETVLIDTDDDGELDSNYTKTWQVSIATFDMSATARTDGVGPAPITDVTFWIWIEENEYNVFEGPDDVRAYVIEVVTRDRADLSDEVLMDVTPAAGGFAFDMVSMKTESPPQWILDSGYQKSLSYFQAVKIPLKVKNAAPFLVGLVRAEQQATWKLQLRVLVFGFWSRMSPYDLWIPPSLWEGFFPWLGDLLQLIIGGLLGLIMTVVVVKLPLPPAAKIVIVGITWIVVFIAFGWLGIMGFGP